MKILKALLGIVCCIVIFGIVLHLGGYTFDEFASSIGLKNPSDVFGSYLPDDTTTSVDSTSNSSTNDTSNTSSSTTSSIEWFPDDLSFSNNGDSGFFNDSSSNVTTSNTTSTSSTTSSTVTDSSTSSSSTTSNSDLTITVGDTTSTVTNDNVADFIKWLQDNYNENDSISVENSNSTESTNNESITNESTTTEVKYNYTLQNTDDLQAIVNSITVVDELPEYDNYDRTEFEKPVVSYTLGGKKVNRNDYAWKTSSFFDADSFTYTCPYTGKVITDLDDKKEDNDFGNLDYDHIVSLGVVSRSCPEWWTDEDRNRYAYDQAVGVDVLNSANRSKSDKTPSEWLPSVNAEDYCYTYLLICHKYELRMSEADIKVCNDTIRNAMAKGEAVTALNNYICEAA